jgi:hypothetical protein
VAEKNQAIQERIQQISRWTNYLCEDSKQFTRDFTLLDGQVNSAYEEATAIERWKECFREEER